MLGRLLFISRCLGPLVPMERRVNAYQYKVLMSVVSSMAVTPAISAIIRAKKRFVRALKLF